MNQKKLESQILWIVLGMLLLIVISLIFIIITSQFKLNFEIWGPISTFGGALTGAIITGAIAILVNIKDNEKRALYRKEGVERNLKIIKHYIKLMEIEYIAVQISSKKYNEVYNPFSEIEWVVINGEEIPKYYPPDFLINEYNKTIQPLKDNLKFSAKQISLNFEKMEQMDISDLDMKSLDNYLYLIREFKISELFHLNEMIESDVPVRNNEEIENILKLLSKI